LIWNSLRSLRELSVCAVKKGSETFTAEAQRTQRGRREQAKLGCDEFTNK